MSKVIGVVDVAKHSLDACLMKQRFDISKIQNVVLHDEVNRMELDSNVVNSLTKACASQRINISFAAVSTNGLPKKGLSSSSVFTIWLT